MTHAHVEVGRNIRIVVEETSNIDTFRVPIRKHKFKVANNEFAYKFYMKY